MDFDQIGKEFDKVVNHLKDELAQIRTGRATPELLESIKVEAYETVNPLKNLGNISTADSKSLTVQVWDKTIIDSIVKGIDEADLGLRCSVEGDVVRVTVPDLTEERRKDLVKVMKERVETARISVRNVRRENIKMIDEMVKEGALPEDDGKRFKEEVDKMMKERNEEIETLKEAKEQDLMTV